MSDATLKRFESHDYLASATPDAHYDKDFLQAEERRCERLYQTHGVMPTIGCEVEVKWSSLFPDLAKEYFGDQDEYGRFERRYADLPYAKRQELDERCRDLDAVLKPRYELTRAAGIPVGGDAYWEFAHAPAFSFTTLAAEVDLLTQHGLIPSDAEHSLHVTLGGLIPGKGGVCLIIGALELVGSSRQRIMQVVDRPRGSGNTGWALKSKDGIRARGASELALDQEGASELRTLSVTNSEGLYTTLHWAQTLGAVLMAFRQRQTTPHPLIIELGSLWSVYRSTIKSLLESKGLPSDGSWGTPVYNRERWTTWASAIANASVEGTCEHDTTAEIGRIVQCADELLVQLSN